MEKSQLSLRVKKYRHILVSLFFVLIFMSMIIAIRSQEVTPENQADVTHSNENPISLAVIKEYSEIFGVLLEAGVVVLLWKTVKDFSELAKVSKLQTEVRFRPWVGPSGGFELLREADDKKQYSIAMKNFGEVPASDVIVSCTISDTKPDKSNGMNDSKSDNNRFHLGPLLPGMEKRYWVFIENERYRKTMEGTSNIFIFIYFSYVYSGGKSGYGMISQLDNKTSNFVHREMWID
ncbi:MAG: hypothetical protein ACRD9Q_10805 [Nitrososphaeraceae archaeon]